MQLYHTLFRQFLLVSHSAVQSTVCHVQHSRTLWCNEAHVYILLVLPHDHSVIVNVITGASPLPEPCLDTG